MDREPQQNHNPSPATGLGQGPQLPLEILRMVMETIGMGLEGKIMFGLMRDTRDRKQTQTTLRSAMMVNKTWASEAIRVLWKHPTVKALSRIEDRNRRQFYAGYVEKLQLSYCHAFTRVSDERVGAYSKLEKVELPRLKRVSLKYFYGEGEDVGLGVDSCIVSSLEEVEFQGSYPDEDLIYLLQDRCSNLRRIAFEVRGFVYSDSGHNELAEFIRSYNYKSLRSIYLYSEEIQQVEAHEEILPQEENAERFILSRTAHDEQLLTSLANRDGLEELEMNTLFRFGTYKKVLKHIGQPFKDLRKFTFHTQAMPASFLISKLNPNSLTSLEISIDDIFLEVNPLPEFGRLVNLRNLQITYMQDKTLEKFPTSDLLPLKNLKHLRQLLICGDFPLSSKMTDDEFIPLVEHWPELEELQLDVDCDFSTATLTSLGQHCPRLKSISISGLFDLIDWIDIPRPLFPHLHQLTLVDLVDKEGESR